MFEKLREWFGVLIQEVLGNGIGFGAGIWSYELVSKYFIEKSVWNLWGVFSSRTAVDSDTFVGLQIAAAGLIGFIVLRFTNITARLLFRAMGILKRPKEDDDSQK